MGNNAESSLKNNFRDTYLGLMRWMGMKIILCMRKGTSPLIEITKGKIVLYDFNSSDDSFLGFYDEETLIYLLIFFLMQRFRFRCIKRYL